MLSDTWKPVSPASTLLRLNAPFGARRFLTRGLVSLVGLHLTSLNAPYGARRFLTWLTSSSTPTGLMKRLNAPYGARCFLTLQMTATPRTAKSRLNAPYGARCFLTCAERQRNPVC